MHDKKKMFRHQHSVICGPIINADAIVFFKHTMNKFHLVRFKFFILLLPVFWDKVNSYEYGIACEVNNSCRISNLTITKGSPPIEPPSDVVVNKITRLSFVNTRMASIPLELMNGMIKLEFLNASGCQLQSVSSNSFGVKRSYALQKLGQLVLARNQITALENLTFAGAKNLRTLNLAWNNIGNIAEESFVRLQALIELDLSHNQITALSDRSFLDLKMLRKLKLNDNRLKTNAESLLRVATKLTNLDFSNNQLTTIGSLTALRALESIDLSGNPTVVLLTSAFPPSLLSLAIRGCSLNASTLRNGLVRYLPNLKTLDLSSNSLKNISLAWFTEQSRLQTLNIAGNGIQQILNYEKFGEVMPSLNTIDITKNSWDCGYLKELVKLLRKRKITITRKDINFVKSLHVEGVICTNPSRISKFKSAIKNLFKSNSKTTKKSTPLVVTTSKPKITIASTIAKALVLNLTTRTTAASSTTVKITTQLTTIPDTSISSTAATPTTTAVKVTDQPEPDIEASTSVAKVNLTTLGATPMITSTMKDLEDIAPLTTTATQVAMTSPDDFTTHSTVEYEYFVSSSTTEGFELQNSTSFDNFTETILLSTPNTQPTMDTELTFIEYRVLIFAVAKNIGNSNLWLVLYITILALSLSLLTFVSLIIFIAVFTTCRQPKDDKPSALKIRNDILFDFNVTIC